ncbi:aminotransferase class V-fold PLP-dependent enzyme [Romboutsia maritimum]|uniref:Aminotransferase class V-fold PLP-dependent enzyme n=1 Tax=Romboutsia maritimum TaxID=2020948 RepID=A0A371IT40_9FIRM|nr:aminotransferase class V-fold PLP-dependent enzyme [Romboutsia maritimum]RDY23625.1 aminotransferase class V-fold PLP-dependent enzyme [Romboutsia maritimum]
MKNSIIGELTNIERNKLISFHTPGHKLGKIYDKLGYSSLLEKLYRMDTTEIEGTDNLHSPEGIIKDSQEKASQIFKSEETYFLVNGSTCGINAAIMSVCKPKDKIIVNRDCHQSIINTCILGDIDPIYIKSNIDSELNVLKGVNVEHAIEVINHNLEAKAIVLTYPTYYGMVYDLKLICDYAHSKDITVIVDEAHGAHLGLNDNLPKTALEQGADIVIQSTHKTLPAFTQASMLHTQGNRINKNKLVEVLRMVESSSPSYMLMASLELATDILEINGRELMEELLFNIEKFKSKFHNNKNIEVYDTDDKTKIFISCGKIGITGYKLESILRNNYNIQVELSNYYGVLLICTISNDDNDFNTLEIALNEILKNNLKNNRLLQIINYPQEIPLKLISPREAFYKDKKNVKIYESIGKVSGEYIIPYPPGISLISPGEVITKDIIDYVLLCREKGMNISGIKDTNLEFIDIID